MGNIFSTLQCKTCQKQGVEPAYFTKLYSNGGAYLMDTIDDEKYNKYGKRIDNHFRTIPHRKDYFYVCSNGHLID